jgi:hypothetical protein
MSFIRRVMSFVRRVMSFIRRVMSFVRRVMSFVKWPLGVDGSGRSLVGARRAA